MSASPANQNGKRPLICACCDLPFAKVQGGKLVITSRHDKSIHSNALTAEDLQRLLDELRDNGE